MKEIPELSTKVVVNMGVVAMNWVFGVVTHRTKKSFEILTVGSTPIEDPGFRTSPLFFPAPQKLEPSWLTEHEEYKTLTAKYNKRYGWSVHDVIYHPVEKYDDKKQYRNTHYI
jgi:hypothetical protein